jgi:hypothetical protein
MIASVLKVVALLAVIVYAGIGVLLVADQIAAEAAQSLAIKTAIVLAILAAASVIVGLIMKNPSADKPQ